jgi:drug/metabolite transporter (DMT)-like permease
MMPLKYVAEQWALPAAPCGAVQVAIASYGDVTLSAIGFVLQVSSIMMDATRCCYLQKVLQLADVKVTPLMTLSHVAPFSAAALFVPTVFMEGPKLMNTLDSWWSALPLVLFSGVLASALNLVIFKIISLTSALSTSLSGVIKEWACILVAMFVYNTHVTYLQWFGYSIAIAGLLWYQLGKAKLPGGGTPLGGKPLTVSRSGSNWAAAVKESLPVYLVYANQVQQLRDGASATEDGAFGKANKQSQ